MTENKFKIGFTPKGEYSNSVTYSTLDVVSYNNGAYVSIVDENLGNLPTKETYWKILVNPTTINNAIASSTTATNLAINAANAANAAIVDINDIISKKIDTKFGFQRAVANTEAGTYTIQSFGTSTDADKYDEDPVTNLGLLINSYQILMGSGTGGGGSTIYKLKCVNNLPSLYFSVAKNDPALINFTFTSVDSDNNNTNEGGVCHVFVKNSIHTTYTEVESFNVVSNLATSHDVSKWLADGSNNVMIKIVGEVSELTTPAVVYIITSTTLSLDISSFQWWTAKLSDFILPCLIAGNVKKILKIKVTGNDYTKDYSIDLGTATYTDTSYNVTIQHPGKVGIFKISAYLINSDNTVQTKASEYNIMCSEADDNTKLFVINNVASKLINWSDNTILSYSVYDGNNQNSYVQFNIKRDENLIYTTNSNPSTNVSNNLLYNLEVETEEISTFNVTIDFVDTDSTLYPQITLPVDNSFSFSATSGYYLYMNPKTRSNSQTNYKNIVNAVDNSEITATWQNMNWETDGWIETDDNKNVLRLLSGDHASINTELLKTECAATGKTIEIKVHVKNISDYDTEWFKIGSVDNYNNFVGIKIYPGNILWYTHLKHDSESQSYALDDDTDLHITMCVIPNTYGNVGYNTVYIYINGKKCRVFNYETADLFSTAGNIELGSDGCDVDIYGIRVYNVGLSSASVLDNYTNFLSTRSEKADIYNANDIMNATQTEIDFNKIKNVKRTFIFDKPFPNKANPANVTGNIQVIYPEDSTRNVTITNVTAAGQGSTSKGYYEWNIKFTINSNSVFTFADGTTQTGGKWKIDPTQLAGTKFTAKLNWASMSQDHKCGSVNAYTDLYKKVGLTNPAITANPLVRVSVYQQPYVGFCKQTNEDGEDVYTFQGEYTWGADKGDKYCFGYDTNAFPNLIAIEGSDNAPLPALYRVPWNTNRITYQVIDSRGIDGWVYNDAATFDFDGGTTSKISQFIPAYNLVHSCSNLIMPFNGTLDQLNSQVTTYRTTQYMYWISKTDDPNYGNLYYYEAGDQLYIEDDIGSGVINLFTQLVDRGYGLTSTDTSGKTADQLNTLFINARIQKAKLEWGTYWDINDALFHDCWVEITAGTDQRAKNTYPYIFGTTSDKKVRWRVDDTDTIWPTNNQGLLTKNYSTEVGDKYEDGAPEWNGETSVFHNVLALAFKTEYYAMMANVIAAMEQIGGATTGTDYDKLLAWYQKYYISVKNWFPAKMVNEFGKHFEIAELKYKSGDYQSDTEPIAQIVGDAMSPDMAFFKKRIVYLMSKYSVGLFSTKSSGAITVRAAGNEIVYDITPAIDLYPTIANGESIIRGDRTFAGNTREIVVNLGGSSDQQNTILGSDYLLDIGDWHNKNVHGALSITGKRLTQLLLGSKTETPAITITSLTLGNCYSLKKLELSGITSLQGTLDLSDCSRLSEVYASDTNLTNINLPAGGILSKIEYSSTMQQIFLKNFDKLTTANVNFNNSPVRILWLENLPNVDTMALLSSCLSTVTNVRVTNISATAEELFDIYNISLLGGIDNNGNITNKAVLKGNYHVQYARADILALLNASCPELIITYDTLYHIPIVTVTVVTNQTGVKLPGATVVINGVTLTTNSDGKCSYTPTNTNTYSATISKDGYISTTANGVTSRSDIFITIGLVKIPVITINVVTDQTSEALSGASIVINNTALTTDSNGSCSYMLDNTNAYSLSASKNGYISTTDNKTGITTDITTTIRLVKIPTITMVVTNKRNELLSGATVVINNTTLTTDSNGVCTYSILPSTDYSVTATYPGYLSETASGTTTKADITLPIQLPDLPAVTVIINDQTGTALSGATVVINNFTLITDSNGSCSYTPTNGTYSVTASKDGYTTVTNSGSLFIDNITVTLQLVRIYSITFTVLSTHGDPLSGCNITIGTEVISTNSSGIAVFHRVPGTYSYSAVYSTQPASTGSLTISNSNITQSLTFTGDIDELKPTPNGNIQLAVSGSGSFTVSSSASNSAVIVWGDGATTTMNGATTYTHTYSTTGIHQIEVQGGNSLTTLNAYLTSNIYTGLVAYWTIGNSLVTSISFTASIIYIGGDVFKNETTRTSFESRFSGYNNLKFIEAGLFDYSPNVTNFYQCFNNCTSLKSIPAGLFDKCTLVTSFMSCFYGCSKLTSIPAGLFDKCTSVYYFNSTFDGTGITSIPADLFKYNIQVAEFSNTFAGCRSLISIPDGLFNNCVMSNNFYDCFGTCTALTSLPVDLFRYNTAVTNFNKCFYNCTALTSLPVDLFRYNTLVTDFSYCFGNCTVLTSLPVDLFRYNTAVTNFNNCFNQCTGLTSLPVDLFKYNTAVTNFGSCFYQCIKLIQLPVDLFRYNIAVTNFSYCFYTCTALTSLPTDLFRYNTLVTNFNNCFYNCTALTSLPVDLFRYNTAVTNFSTCFSQCTGLTSLPVDLFKYNTVVTSFSYCFSYCTKLVSVELPTVIPNLGSNTYIGCVGLQFIETVSDIPQIIGSNIFDNTNNCPIYVPYLKVDTYKAASGWSTYASRITTKPLSQNVNLTINFKLPDGTVVHTQSTTISSGSPVIYTITQNAIQGYLNDTTYIDLSTGTSVSFDCPVYSPVTYTVTKHYKDPQGNTLQTDDSQDYIVGDGGCNNITITSNFNSIVYNSVTYYLITQGVPLVLTSNTEVTFIYTSSIVTWSGSWTQYNVPAYGVNSYKSNSIADNGSTVETITFSGYNSVTFSCRSYGESGFDYMTLGNIDATCSRTTYKSSMKGMASATVWTDYTYTFPDTGSHYIQVCYSKDGSGTNGDDACYIYIKSTT